MPGDEAFYYLHKHVELQGVALTHVNDLILTENEDFIEKISDGIAHILMVSKVDKDKFRFTGWDWLWIEDKTFNQVLWKKYGRDNRNKKGERVISRNKMKWSNIENSQKS